MTKAKKYTLFTDYEFHFDTFSNNLKNRITNEIGNKEIIHRYKFILSRDNLYIFEGYKWDGASPKIKFLRWFIGTPDGRKDQMYYPTLLHDILYESLESHPLSRKTVDVMFYELMKQRGWKFSKLYYAAVRIFGGIYHKAKQKQ